MCVPLFFHELSENTNTNLPTVSATFLEYTVLCGIAVKAAALEQVQGDFLLW